MLDVRLVSSADLPSFWLAYGECYDGLARQHPFTHPAMVETWYEAFGVVPYIYAAYDQQALVGAACFWVQRWRRVLRRLVPVGRGSFDYEDWLVADGREDVIAALLAAIDRGGKWDLLDIWRLPAGTPVCDYLSRHRADAIYAIPGGVCPWLELPDTAEALAARLPKKLVADNRRQLRRLETIGSLTFEKLSSAAAIEPLLQTMVELKKAVFQHTGGDHALMDDPRFRRWLTEVTARGASSGLIEAHVLRLDQRVIAVHVGHHIGGELYWHYPTYDPELHSYSPGKILLWRVLLDAIESGCQRFNFLFGSTAYKQLYADRRHDLYGFRMHSGSLRGRLDLFRLTKLKGRR